MVKYSMSPWMTIEVQPLPRDYFICDYFIYKQSLWSLGKFSQSDYSVQNASLTVVWHYLLSELLVLSYPSLHLHPSVCILSQRMKDWGADALTWAGRHIVALRLHSGVPIWGQCFSQASAEGQEKSTVTISRSSHDTWNSTEHINSS